VKHSDELEIARNSTDPKVLADLVRGIKDWRSPGQDAKIRGCVAYNKHTPDSVLRRMCNSGSAHVLERLAHNPSASSDVLWTLSASSNSNVRLIVASRSDTPVEVITQLAQDQDEAVRLSVAGNPAAPSQVLTDIATAMFKEENGGCIAQALSRNTSTPVSVLNQLSVLVNDETSWLRRGVPDWWIGTQAGLERNPAYIHGLE
jgi:hypothetical protein